MGLSYNIDLTSSTDESGFEEAEEAMQQVRQVSDQLGLSVDEVSNRIRGTGLEFDEASGKFSDGEKSFINLSDAADELKSEQAALAGLAEEMGESIEFVEAQLNRSSIQLMRNAENAQQFRDVASGAFLDTGQAVNSLQQQMQRFRFDMLSLMFAGMELGNALKSLTGPAMESAGVFDLISDMLEIFFMPAALMALDIVRTIMDAFLSLPEPVQKAINIFALAGIAVASLTKFLTILKLNVAPLLNLFRIFAPVIKKFVLAPLKGLAVFIGKTVVGAIAGLVAVLSAPLVALGALVAAIGGFAFAWKNNWFDIRQRTGRAVQKIGGLMQNFSRVLAAPLKPMDLMIAAVNRLFGKDIPRMDDAVESVGETVEEMGQSFEESGEKMNEMQEQHPDEDGLLSRSIDRITPDLGMDETFEGPEQGTRTDFRQTNNFDIDGAQFEDGDELAEGIANRQEEVMGGTFRGR